MVYVEPTVMLTGEKRQTKYAGTNAEKKQWLAKTFEGVNVLLVASSGEAGSAGIIRSDYEHSMRAVALPVWKAEGMRPSDIGVLADSDELFSRHFLKALLTCDVPQFRVAVSCKNPKVLRSFARKLVCVIPIFSCGHWIVVIGIERMLGFKLILPLQ